MTGFWKSFGPGLLFAGTAVGLSHLVQSTRAGAIYGLGLLGAIALIHILKYPLFRFGAHYAAVTGTSLVTGYRNQGMFAVWLLLFVLLSYMFFALGAVSLLSAALIQVVLGWDINTTVFGAAILVSWRGISRRWTVPMAGPIEQNTDCRARGIDTRGHAGRFTSTQPDILA